MGSPIYIQLIELTLMAACLVWLLEVRVDPELAFPASTFQRACPKISVLASIDGEANHLSMTAGRLLLDVNESNLHMQNS